MTPRSTKSIANDNVYSWDMSLSPAKSQSFGGGYFAWLGSAVPRMTTMKFERGNSPKDVFTLFIYFLAIGILFTLISTKNGPRFSRCSRVPLILQNFFPSYIYALVARQQSFRLSDLKIRRRFIVRISKRRFHFRTSFESLVSSNMSIFWSSQRYKLAEYLLRYTRVSNSYASRWYPNSVIHTSRFLLLRSTSTKSTNGKQCKGQNRNPNDQSNDNRCCGHGMRYCTRSFRI